MMTDVEDQLPSSSGLNAGGVSALEEKKSVKISPPAADDEADGGDGDGTRDGTLERTGSMLQATSKRDKKIGHRKVNLSTGEVTYKKVNTNTIMGAIQLGIAQSIGSLASTPERDILLQDFDVITKVNFPSAGSSTTPVHSFGDFRFKSYAPIAFRYFRDLFHIQPADFLSSVCLEPLRELSNPGASGSIFYLSYDDEFIIKTVQHKEADFLQTLLPGYYMNLQQNPRTLLPMFFGLFCYQSLGKNIRLVVMNNLLPSNIRIHAKYDLKGSTYKRKASRHERSKPSPTLKDLDWLEDNPEGIYLEANTFEALIKTFSKDCLVLESFKIMDFSFLLGIHNLDSAHREKQQALAEEAAAAQRTSSGDDEIGTDVPTTSSRSQVENDEKIVQSAKKILRQKTLLSAWDAINTEAIPIDLGDEYPEGGIPARNTKGERLLLFLGIIDILQNYRLFKKIEHTWKSVLHDGDTISVHRPGFYAQRFQDFLRKSVFKKIPSPLKHSPSRVRRPGTMSLSTRKSTAASTSVEEKRGRAATAQQQSTDDGPQTAVAGAATARPDLVPEDPLEPSITATPTPFGGHNRGSRRTPASPPSQSARPALLVKQDPIDSSEQQQSGGGGGAVKVERLFASSSGPTDKEVATASQVAATETMAAVAVQAAVKRSSIHAVTTRSASNDTVVGADAGHPRSPMAGCELGPIFVNFFGS